MSVDQPAHPMAWFVKLAAVLGFATALHAIYIAWFGQYTAPGYIRAGVLTASATITVLVNPLAAELGGGKARRTLGWLIDVALIANLVCASMLFLRQVANTDLLIISYSTFEVASAMLAIFTLIELTRRAFGLILAATGALAVLYALFGGGMPLVLQHTGFTPEMVTETIWYGFQGVFGFATAIVILVVFIFIVFGAVLEGSGAGGLMIRMALWATGRTRGGAGHAAIVASSVFGMSSGSVVANVVGTGTVTIPLIKQRGFSGRFAAGLEAAASTGGQLMPPVMGAAAFLMAQLSGTSYQVVCIAALVPALFYYFSLFILVEKEARRLGIEPLSPEERPSLQSGDALRSLMFFAPVVAILVTLAMGRSASMAGFWAVVTTILAGFALNPDLRRNPSRIIEALARGGIAGAQVMMAVGTIGVLVGVFELTGLGLRFASAVSTMSASGLFLPLLLSAAACLVLGMGMPTLPAYLIIVLVLGDSIVKLGVPVLAVHLFVLYFGVLSAITPPVAMASVAAAPIAGAEPVRSSISAVRLALTAFLIPFFFIYEPSLLLVVEGFSLPSFVWAAGRLSLAVWMINSGLAGHNGRCLAIWERIGFLTCGIAVLTTLVPLQLGGLVGSVLLLAWTSTAFKFNYGGN